MGGHSYERPWARKLIIDKGYTPWLENGVWDRFNARERDGGKVMIDKPIRMQMRIMIEEGYWDDEANKLRMKPKMQPKRQYVQRYI